MTIQTTYTDARARLAEFMDRAAQDRETVVITRRGSPDVALISADELRGLQEVAHLFRSPANAQRLLAAMARAERGEGQRMSVEQLRAWIHEREQGGSGAEVGAGG